MGHFVSGEEVDVDDIDKWSALQPARGACLEVNLPTSSLALADDDWGAFLVDRVDAKLDASLKLTCRLLGATSAEAWSALEALVQGEFLTIHLCLSRPCI
jgi:hypothetical protein